METAPGFGYLRQVNRQNRRSEVKKVVFLLRTTDKDNKVTAFTFISLEGADKT